MTAAWAIISLVLGLLLGLAAGFLVGRRSSAPSESKDGIALAEARGKLERADGEIEALKGEVRQLKENQQVGQRLDDLLTPMRDKLKDLESHSRQAAVDRATADAELAERIKQLKEGTDSLNLTTSAIAGVLSNSQVRGRFGEMQLETLFEYAGLVEGVSYRTQTSTTDADGKRRPDFILALPGGGHIILDSKFPLDDFMRAQEASDEQARKTHLEAHARAIIDHAKALQRRGYSNDASTIEFVIMFLPVDALLTAAIDANPRLLDELYKMQVGIATPVTLMPLLMTLRYTWQKHDLTSNAEQIRDLGVTLYDRLRVFGSHFERMGGGLKTAIKAFNAAVGSYDSSVMPQARRMRDHGLPASGELSDIDPIDELPRSSHAPDIMSAINEAESQIDEVGA